ncbi:hypothetical protein [Streptomyces sp. NPDC058548]|uniref:hypothetical protein n=1 Tax=Streptomyces sp. NPDC058548 TaxID=3346545 RepID=UPI003663429E
MTASAGGGSAEERDAAGVRLLHESYLRWAEMPPVVVTLDRPNAWTVLLALQATMTHPDFAGSGMGATVESWGRQLQEALCDDAEVYAVAERGWRRADGGPSAAADAEPDAAAVQLMTDAYRRWTGMSPVSAKAERVDTWTVLMALQLALTHPTVGESPLGPVVEAVGRQLQEGLCDDPELYALAEAGWNRAADVEQDRGRG